MRGPTGNSCGNDDNVGILEGSLGSVVGGEVAGDFLHVISTLCIAVGTFDVNERLNVCPVNVYLQRETKCERDRQRHREC